LFEHLARLDAVGVVHYTSRDIGRWTLDESDLLARLSPRTRALVVVAPNNPTGHVPTPAEWQAIGDICRRHRIALIVDEVFSAYPLASAASAGETGVIPIPTLAGVLQFRLNGLSKLIGLPQAKLGWMRVSGPDALSHQALDALDLIADTYLSVSTPVQVALPALLRDGAAVHAAIGARLHRNLTTLRAALTGTVRVPSVADADDLVLALLARDVLVHPGYFYDLPHDGYLVLSLLTPERDMQGGVQTMCSLPMLQLT
jgi:alanine-synthesizing transaminase